MRANNHMKRITWVTAKFKGTKSTFIASLYTKNNKPYLAIDGKLRKVVNIISGENKSIYIINKIKMGNKSSAEMFCFINVIFISDEKLREKILKKTENERHVPVLNYGDIAAMPCNSVVHARRVLTNLQCRIHKDISCAQKYCRNMDGREIHLYMYGIFTPALLNCIRDDADTARLYYRLKSEGKTLWAFSKQKLKRLFLDKQQFIYHLYAPASGKIQWVNIGNYFM